MPGFFIKIAEYMNLSLRCGLGKIEIVYAMGVGYTV